MQPKAFAAVTLAAVVLFGGYVALGGGTTPSTDSPVEQAPSPTESLQTDTGTPTSSPTERSYPPSIDGCGIGDVPSPGERTTSHHQRIPIRRPTSRTIA
jgi:hypothetical protein